eukprot:1675438-Amphidinium_carterae.1
MSEEISEAYDVLREALQEDGTLPQDAWYDGQMTTTASLVPFFQRALEVKVAKVSAILKKGTTTQ